MIRHITKLIWNSKGKNALLILEIFLAFLVLFAVISFVLFNTDRMSKPIGFDVTDKWVLYMDTYNLDSLERATMTTQLKLALEEMDQIESVSFTNGVNPYGSSTWQSTDDDSGFEISARYAYVDEDFANATDLEITQGRFFKEEDLNATTPPIVVSERFLNEYFPDKPMLDSIIRYSGEHKIIGVMSDYRYGGIFEEEKNTVIFQIPPTHEYVQSAIMHMTPGTNVTYEEKVNKVVEDVTKSTSFIIQHLEDSERRTNSRTWIPMIALLSIAGFLCINVALGLFGVLWYNINKRKSEIGLRRAIGAHTTGIVYQFVMEVLILTSIGLILGIFFAIQVPLLKIMPLSPWLFYRAIIFAILIIVAIVTICALYPSTQASRIQPSAALHED